MTTTAAPISEIYKSQPDVPVLESSLTAVTRVLFEKFSYLIGRKLVGFHLRMLTLKVKKELIILIMSSLLNK